MNVKIDAAKIDTADLRAKIKKAADDIDGAQVKIEELTKAIKAASR